MTGKAKVDWQNRRTDQVEVETWQCPVDQEELDVESLRPYWVQEALEIGPETGPEIVPEPGPEIVPQTAPPALESLAAEAVTDAGQRRRDYSPVLLGLAISAVMHAALLAMLVVTRGSNPGDTAAIPEVVRINLIPPQRQPDPQLTPDSSAQTPAVTPTPMPVPTDDQDAASSSSGSSPQLVREPAPEPDAELPPPAVPEPTPEVEVTVQTAEQAAPEAGVSNLFERDRSDQLSPSSVPLPTVAAVRSQLQQMQENADADAWRRDCTRRQAQSELLDCADDRDYASLPTASSAPREAIYRALNPVRRVSRAQRSLPAIAANVDGVAARLADSDIADGLAEYLLEQTEIGITDESASGNRAVEHMRRMTDRSAAAEQARMLLADPWVLRRSRELEQRKVVER